MGLFSGKKKTYVYTSVSRMVDDADIVPSYKLAVLDYTMSQNSASTRLSSESLSDYLIRANTNNIVARARKARNLAKRTSFSYGMPKSTLVSQEGVDVLAAVSDELERIYPEGVAVFDAYFGPMNNFYFLKPILQEKYGYNYDTNELVEESARIGFKCYMETAVIKYSQYTADAMIDPDAYKQVGPSATAGYTPFRAANPKAAQVPWIENNPMDYDIAEVTVVYADATGTKQSYTLTIDYLKYEPASKPPDAGLDSSDTNNLDPDAVSPEQEATLEDQDYYQANYQYVEGGVTKTGVFIYLYGSGINTRLDNLFQIADAFGSYIPRMYARRNGEPCNKESLKGTADYKSMVALGRTMDLEWTSWVDEIHKSVGSLKDVRQIYMAYALPANTTDPIIQEYMYEYFLGLYGRIPDTFADSSFNGLHRDMIAWGSKRGLSYDIVDNAYNNEITFKSLGYMDINGSIGDVGTVASGRNRERVTTGRRGAQGMFSAYAYITYHYYRKQLTPTTYREVRVYGLTATERVKGGKVTVASDDSDNLLIPLDIAVDHEFNMRQLEELYTKSMYIVLHTIKVVKEKWYQTGIFKAIMFIVTVVVSYFFPPAGVAMYGWMAALYAVAQAIIISIVINLAVKLLVNLGVDVGFAAAVVAVIALFYGGYVALGRTAGVAGVTTQQLLQISSQAFSMSSQGYALQTQKAIQEFNSLMADLTKEEKEIQQAAKDLGLGVSGPLLMFEPPVSIGVRMGESPDDYYDRSIRINNLASTIYSLTERSVDLSVSLPTPQMLLRNIQENLNELSISRV